MQYHLIPQVRLTTGGAVSYQRGRWHHIHLRQGSVDGACGAYSILMALLVLGQLDYDQLTSFGHADGRSRAGKLLAGLEKFPGLFRQGMNTDELSQLLHKNFGQVLSLDSVARLDGNPWQFTMDQLNTGRPVIIRIQGSGCGHWMVVIGVELDEKDRVARLLALDSSVDAPNVCPWNAFITPRRQKAHQYPFEWHSDESSCYVQIEEAVAVWQRT